MALKQVIDDNFRLIRRSLDPSPELLARLRSVEIVKQRLVSIKQQPTLNGKNDALLDGLLEVPDDLQETVMNGFIEALRWSDQDHVANIFRKQSDEFPMSDEHYNIIMNKRPTLCQFMTPNDGLVDRLCLSGVFSDTDRTAFLTKPQVDNMAEETLSILLRKADSCFEKFVRALEETGQSHVAYLLTGVGDPPISDQHLAVLRDKRFALRQFMNPRDGLVDHLVGSSVFSDMNRITVLSKPREQSEETADETVAILMRKSDSAFEKFVKSLNETGQSHVAYLLTGVGPQPMSDQHRELLLEKMHELCKYMDVENGVLDRLVSCKVISLIDARRIRSVPDDNVMAGKLVSSLLLKRDDAFHDFVEAMNYTGQEHAAYILTGEGYCRPLKDELRNMLLSRQRCVVVQMIDSKHSGFISALMSRGVFSSYDEQRVVSVRPDTSYDRNEIILNLVARKSQTAFFNFISALNDTGHTHVVVTLIGVEVVTKIKTFFDSRGEDGDNVPPPADVNSQLLQYMIDDFERNGPVIQKLNELLSQNGVAISAIREGSIQITFTCKFLESLKFFQGLCRSGELGNLLSEVICPQFADQGLTFLEVEVSDEQFENCATIFDRWAPMTSVHRDALQSSAEWLFDKLTVSADLLDELSLRGRRKRAVENAASPKEQVKTLLDIVSRQPDRSFTQLLAALFRTGQREVAKYILAQSQGSGETAGGELQNQTAAAMQADVIHKASSSSKVFRGLFARNNHYHVGLTASAELLVINSATSSIRHSECSRGEKINIDSVISRFSRGVSTWG